MCIPLLRKRLCEAVFGELRFSEYRTLTSKATLQPTPSSGHWITAFRHGTPRNSHFISE